MSDMALTLMSDMACTENLQVIKPPAREGSMFLRSVLECGLEVLRSSSFCSKARSCKARQGKVWGFCEMLYGLLLVAWEPNNFSETDCAVGSVLFLQRFGPYFTSLVVL